ncbi:amidase [Pyrenochaeta sp. DS3sAY3a]|nr:amidase [Pyrenochaeta sp. DS3sAY3a]
MASQSPPDWQTLTSTKRAALLSSIPPSWLLPPSLTAPLTPTSTASVLSIPAQSGILTAAELAITESHDATALIALMLDGTLTSVEVTTAFCKRAAIAQQCVGCLTETMFEGALERARECDEFLRREGRGVGALHGLPVSLKDSFNVKGVQATIGYTAYLSRPPSTTNSVLVDVLHDAGAVFYCKTNLPQTMMTADSHNNIFGRTLNPHNLSLTAGGSTGGEAALLAMKGSILGVATDIAGSNRIPALCCGVSSIKPTASRVPFAGGVPPGRLGAPSAISPVIGPCGRSVRDYELFLRTVMDAQPWLRDEGVLNVPWRRIAPSSVVSETKKLRFGLLRGCKERPLHPPIARALHTAATLLKAHGHSIVLLDDKVPDVYASAQLAFKYFALDPANTPLTIVSSSGEPPIPSLPTAQFAELADWKPSLDALFGMNVERARVCKGWHDVVVAEGLDALLSPGYQATAVPHDTYGVPVYTVLQNLLNYPSGILPLGRASREEDKGFVREGVVYEPAYEPEKVEGAPAHVQITGKPMMDEELIEIMKVVEGIFREHEAA